ncbi:MAG: SDR family oxidoreductase [Nanoarchaeota archaeon]|nr:SDR family oxidoreductase [Nanoarchaeota archaeon]
MKNTVLITGASGGVGFETAKLFYENGWGVYGTSTSDKGIERISSEFPDSTNFKLDLKSKESIDNLVTYLGEIDVLVNNAAVKSKGSIGDLTYEGINEVIKANLSGQIYLTKKIVDGMKGKGGRIINVSSIFGLISPEDFALYSGTKYGLRGFSKGLMRDLLKENILVSTIYPGGINTRFHEKERPEYLDPKDVADAIYYIASRPKGVLVSELTIVSDKEKRIP